MMPKGNTVKCAKKLARGTMPEEKDIHLLILLEMKTVKLVLAVIGMTHTISMKSFQNNIKSLMNKTKNPTNTIPSQDSIGWYFFAHIGNA